MSKEAVRDEWGARFGRRRWTSAATRCRGFPVAPNTTAIVNERLVLWLGPDEWLVLVGRESDYPDALAAVDVSANRAALELAGPEAVDVLAQGCALDLDESVFATGLCAQTLLTRAEVILHRTVGDAFTILVCPSFSPTSARGSTTRFSA